MIQALNYNNLTADFSSIPSNYNFAQKQIIYNTIVGKEFTTVLRESAALRDYPLKPNVPLVVINIHCLSSLAGSAANEIQKQKAVY